MEDKSNSVNDLKVTKNDEKQRFETTSYLPALALPASR